MVNAQLSLTLREAYNCLQPEIGFSQDYQTFVLWAKNDVGVNPKARIKYPIDETVLNELRIACQARANTRSHIGRNKGSKLIALRKVREAEEWTGSGLMRLLTQTGVISKSQLYRRCKFSTEKRYSQHEAIDFIVGLPTAITRSA